MQSVYPQSNTAHPAHLSPAYRSSIKRAPQKPLIPMRHTLSELTGPVYGHETVRENDSDLTTQHNGEPLGERIIVHGHATFENTYREHLDIFPKFGPVSPSTLASDECDKSPPLCPDSPVQLRSRCVTRRPSLYEEHLIFG